MQLFPTSLGVWTTISASRIDFHGLELKLENKFHRIGSKSLQDSIKKIPRNGWET